VLILRCRRRTWGGTKGMRWLARRGRGYPGGLMVSRSALRADSVAMLGKRARCSTPSVRCAHCGRTVAASQFTKRAARAALSPALLTAAQIAPPGTPCRECNRRRLSLSRPAVVAAAGCGGRRWRACGAPKRTGCVAARAARFQNMLGATVRAHERSECGELSARPHTRALEGSRHAVPTAEPKRHRLPPHPAAAQTSASRTR
jgi:hypothetical protein